MKQKARMIPVLFAALLLTAGCRKGNGTESIPDRGASKGQGASVPVAEDPNADSYDALFTDVTEDKNAKKDTPFPAENAVRPQQEIVMVMIYDNTEEQTTHTQAVNYFDRDGNTYRYRHPLDAEGDWIGTLLEDYRSGAAVVNIMSAEEKQTLWALAAQAEELKNAPLKTKSPGKDVYGVKWLYLISGQNEPVMLARYDDTCVCCDTPEVTAFADWFRYFLHDGFTFSG